MKKINLRLLLTHLMKQNLWDAFLGANFKHLSDNGPIRLLAAPHRGYFMAIADSGEADYE